MIAYFDEMDQISDERLETMMFCLPSDYRKRLEQAKKRDRKVQRALSYLLLQYCIRKEYPGMFIGDFSYGEHGKPFIKGAKFHFNYSHTKSAVACAVSDAPIGIDVQDIVENYQKVMMKACSDREIRWIEESKEPARDFTRLWTLKEAYVKQKGTGIWDSIHQLDFSYHTEDFWQQWNRYFCVKKENSYMIVVCSEKQEKQIERVGLRELLELK